MSEEIMMDASADMTVNKKKTLRIPRRVMQYYTVFLGIVLGLLILALCLMTPFQTFLTQYEMAQPNKAADAVFDLLFADPDWGLLYDMAKIKATDFEGRAAFQEYMERKVGDRKLHYVEVPNGLSKGKRYSVRLGHEEIACFTTNAYEDGVSTFPLWNLDTIELYFTREQSVTITKMPDHTVYINGVPLDENYTIVYVETLAENYLPGELDGYHYVQQRVDGLLIDPEIVVVDENGDPLPLLWNPVTGVYSTEIPTSPAMTEEERTAILAAAEAELQFSVRKMSVSELRKFFQANSPAYIWLNDQPPAVEKCVSYRFIDSTATVTDFYRYSNDTFSAKVHAEMQVGVSNGDQQTISLDITYIFNENGAGKYMVAERVDADLQKIITSVLVHFECDGEVVGSFVNDVDDHTPAAPILDDRDGERFLGWGRKEADGTLTLIMKTFSETEFQMVDDEKLTHGTLYAVFGNPEAE